VPIINQGVAAVVHGVPINTTLTPQKMIAVTQGMIGCSAGPG